MLDLVKVAILLLFPPWPRGSDLCSGLLTCRANQCSCAVLSADLSWHFTWWSAVTHAHVLHALALAALALLAPCFPPATGCSRKLSIATIAANFYPFHCLIFLFLRSFRFMRNECAHSINATDLRCVMSADGGHMSRLIFPLIVTTLSLVLTNTASTKFELFSILTMKNIFSSG